MANAKKRPVSKVSLAKVAAGVAIVSPLVAAIFAFGKFSNRLSVLEDQWRTHGDEIERTKRLADPKFQAEVTGRIAESAKQQVQKWIAETNLGSLARLPVGSMVPYVGSLDVLADYPEWRLCDGEPLLGELYKDSPFYKEKLPEVHNVFLRGTKEPGKRLVPGGSDAEAHDHRVPHQHGMDHTHKGVTSDGRPKNAPKADHHHEGGNHDHEFVTMGPSSTSTSVEIPSSSNVEISTVPRHIHVFYIMKVL